MAAEARGKGPNQVRTNNFRGKKKVYYERLVQLRDELIDEVAELSGYSLTAEKQAGEESADVGSDNFLREMEIGLMSAEGAKVKAIQDAIKRLEEGGYGTCQECGEKIAEGRLEAIPYARHCIECKSKLESGDALGVS